MATVWDQYIAEKAEYRDALLLFQLGAFYQAYYHDAAVIHQELGNRLLNRALGDGRRVPTCSVPVKGGRAAVATLAGRGYRVAICGQDPKTDGGLQKRRVCQVVEPPDGVPVMDLSEEWDAYLQNVPPGDLPPRRRSSRKDAPYVPPLRLLDRLLALDLSKMTPKEAMKLLYEWKQEYGGSPS